MIVSSVMARVPGMHTLSVILQVKQFMDMLCICAEACHWGQQLKYIFEPSFQEINFPISFTVHGVTFVLPECHMLSFS
jgi:hypothetical protein